MDIRLLYWGVKAVFSRPGGAIRLDDISRRVSERLGEPLTVAVQTKLTFGLIRKLRKIERDAFCKELRYSKRDFWLFRSGEKDLRVLTLSDQNGVCVGFCLGYCSGAGATERYFIDVLAFTSLYRKEGIFALLMPALELIKSMGYKSINIHCDDKSIDGLDLPGLYKKFGFVEISYSEEEGHQMELAL